ncbi:MAG: FecR family protein [Polyangiaceae bacterium]
MIRLVTRWVRASDAALPPLDLEQGAERLLRARNDRPRKRATTPLWLAAAALTVIVVVLLSIRSLPTKQFTVDNRPAVAGVHLSESAAEQVLRFSEGSVITLNSGSSLDVREVGGHGAHLAIDHGSVNVDIVPRPDARWTIDAGPFVVRVLGTAFRVDWQPESQHFVVSVFRGTVSVSGPMLVEGRAINADTRCTIDWKEQRILIETMSHADAPRPEDVAGMAPRAIAAGTAETLRAHPPSTLPQPLSSAEKRSRSGSSRSVDRRRDHRSEGWRDLERAGHFDRAIEEVERVGLDSTYELASAEDLMSLARAARFVGREDVSKGALLSCRRRFPGSQSAAMAAYLLGRNATPSEAVQWFTTYLHEQPDGVWAREASGRLIEANRATGNVRAAREAAKQYLVRYPAGPHAEFAKMVLEN